MLSKTGQPVRFEVTEHTRDAVQAWIAERNLWAVQLLLGHANIQSTVAYLGLEVDDALEIAEHTEI